MSRGGRTVRASTPATPATPQAEEQGGTPGSTTASPRVMGPRRRSGPRPGSAVGVPVDVGALLGQPLSLVLAGRGLGVAELAERVGTRPQTVRRWLGGYRVGARFVPELLLALGRSDAAQALLDVPVGGPGPEALLVRDRLGELDLSISDLVATSGVNRTSVFAWLSGRGGLSGDNLARICEAVGWPADRLAPGRAERGGDLGAEPIAARLRRRRHLSRRELVAAAQVTEQTLRRVEAGEEASAAQLTRIATALSMDDEERAELLEQVRPATTARARARGVWAGAGSETRLHQWVTAAAAARGWNRSQVARHLGVTRQALGIWLLGSSAIADPAVLERVAVFVERPAGEVAAAMAADGRPWRAAGARLRAKRLAAGLSQQQLGDLVKADKRQVASWETGAIRPSHQRLVELLERFPELLEK